jgi:hypothetical protein
MELVAALVRIQQNARMSDRAFAASLGVPRSTWNGYKLGYPISLGFVQKAVAVYPQVKPAAEKIVFALISDKSSKRRVGRKVQQVAS